MKIEVIRTLIKFYGKCSISAISLISILLTLYATNITGSNAFYVTNELVDKCKTKGQTLEQLYSPANFELFNYNVAHAPTNKYLIDKLNEQKNFNSN